MTETGHRGRGQPQAVWATFRVVFPLILLPLQAHAQEGSREVDPASVTYQQGVAVIAEKKLQIFRSDREALEKGTLRSDSFRVVAPRQTSPMIIYPLQPAPPSAARVTTSSTPSPQDVLNSSSSQQAADLAEDANGALQPESDAISGLQETNDPVLALFDGGDGRPEPTSFAQAMRGRRSDALWLWPIPARAKQTFSSAYGPRKDPFHGHLAFHGGIDIAADEGTPVLAVAEGEVREVKTDAGFGNYIGIELKDGTIARYGHLNAQNVREGQHVHSGQAIGTVGKTGRATGPHLDFRVSRSGVRFDPLTMLDVPNTLALNGVTVPPVIRQSVRPKIASNAVPRQPMVIKVTD